MKYKGRIFKKYIIISALLITGCVVLLGLFFISYMNDYWHHERTTTLRTTSQNIAGLIRANWDIDEEDDGELSSLPAMSSFISMFSQSCNADIIVADRDGNILLCSDNLTGQATTLSADFMKSWVEGEGRPDCIQTNFDGLYPDTRIVAGQPITLSNFPFGNSVVAVAFTISRTQRFNVFADDYFKAVILLVIFVFLFAYLGLLFLNYKTYKPLTEIANVVNAFKKGDFEKRVNLQRNDEIGDLALAFNDMAETLSASENARRNFISNVSHELKTPMTTIAGFIDGILDGTIPHEIQGHYLSIVSDEVKRLSRLVKTMLDLSHIDNGEFNIKKEQINIAEIITKVMLSFEQKLNEKKIDVIGLDKLGDLIILGDYDMIYQVIYNLIENAVKFTNDGGYIEIQSSSKANITIKIKNSGMGIPKEDLPMIFDKFYKTDKSRSKDKKGMGLGLYIVKKMINSHGGEIRVDSIEQEYCCFTFSFPKK